MTLVFDTMAFVNLAHRSLYMTGANFAATFVAWTSNFILGTVMALGTTVAMPLVGSRKPITQ